MVRLFLGAIFYCFCFGLFAQSSVQGNRQKGMAATGVAQVAIGSTNQATLAFIDSSEIQLFTLQKFNLKELNTYYLLAAHKTKSGVFGIKSYYTGVNDYKRNAIGLSFSKVLYNNFSIGIQLNSVQHYISNYGTSSILTTEVGLLTKLSKTVHLGVHISNPINTEKQTEKGVNLSPPSSLTAGVSYKPKDFLINLDVHKESNRSETSLRIGTEYTFYKQYFLRVGTALFPNYYSFGAGIQLQALKIDFSFNNHQKLGNSTGISIGYLF